MADHISPPDHPDLTQNPIDAEVSSLRGGGRFAIPVWGALPLMIVALVLAALILSRVAGPLYGLLFPDPLPVPGGSEEVDHVQPDKGTEYWIYRTLQSGSDVAEFYEDEGGLCRYTVRTSPNNAGESDATGVQSVARCTGESDGGGGSFSWEVYISEGYSPDEGPTVFRIYKFG